MGMRLSFVWLSAFALCAALGVRCMSQEEAGKVAETETVLDALDFGVMADGQTDDGPAIQIAVAKVLETKGPVRLFFPTAKQIRVTSAPERYLFRLNHSIKKKVTIDGGGSTFLLSPEIRFLRMFATTDITFRNLKIDFSPLPFADATVTAVNAKERYLDVRLAPWVKDPPLGGPTKEDGEQAFFGMLWYPGTYGSLSRHYMVKRMERGPDAGTVRVFAADEFKEFGDIKPDVWKISLPVPGIAHRYGPGACLDLTVNNWWAVFEDIELWSAPWFGFRVMRGVNATFRRVRIRPKPESGRLMSTWRDGFHVKGNGGELIWEDCVLSGMNDDAFNISTHTSHVTKVSSPTEIVVQQTYPLTPIQWVSNGPLSVADFETRTLVGDTRLEKVIGVGERREIQGQEAATPVTLKLTQPVEGLKEGAIVWQPGSANPHTTLRRCRIENSCRFQTPVTLDHCEVTAFLWFYGEKIEGPFPSNVVVRDCILRRGRGNPNLAVSFLGRAKGAEGPSAVHDVTFERNQVWGHFEMTGVDDARVIGNEFREAKATVRIEDCRNLVREEPKPDGAPADRSGAKR